MPAITKKAPQSAGLFYHIGLFFTFFAAAEALVDQTGKASADQRGNDEDPQMAESRTTSEDGLRNGTGRVDRGVGQRDADEVDEHQSETDGQTTELAVGMTVVGDAKVKTASMIKAPHTLMSQ